MPWANPAQRTGSRPKNRDCFYRQWIMGTLTFVRDRRKKAPTSGAWF